eukprot:scaffold108424_cov30-Tisochrysis_lutea.AAC.2
MLTPRTSFRTSPEAVGWLSVGPRRHSARLGGSTVLAGRDARQSPRASVLSRSIRASGLGNSKRGMGGLLQLARSASVPMGCNIVWAGSEQVMAIVLGSRKVACMAGDDVGSIKRAR